MSKNSDIDKLDFQKLRSDDNQAFERLFRKYYSSLCDYCIGITAEQSISEDIVQDAFVYLWHNRKKIEITTSLKSYLYSSVRNGALNYLKKLKTDRKHNPLMEEFINDLLTTDYSEEELLKIDKIKSVLSQLPEQCRKVFFMSNIDGLKYKEIGEELDISVNTVKTHISKAYRIIREQVNSSTDFVMVFMACRLFIQKK